jgi:multidrug efflux system membrane fusion protein
MNVRRIGAAVVLALLAIGLAAVRAQRVREQNDAPTMQPAPVVVEVAAVRHGAVQESRRFLGQVVAGEEAPLAARILSQVLAVDVREGDTVQRGQRLIELDSRELDDAVGATQAAVAAAGEGVAAAESAYAAQRDATGRDQVLVDARAISREEWERANASLAAAKAGLEAARAQLTVARRAADSAATRRGYALILAPFDGVVSARHVDPGDLAAPGRPLVTLVRTAGLRVRTKVAADTLASVTVGRLVRLETPAGSHLVRIARVFPAMDGSHLATFEADLPPSGLGLMAGSTVPVDVLAREVEGLAVPAGALLESDSNAAIFTVADGRAHVVPVRVTARSADDAIVSGDVHAGDHVVVGRPSRLMQLAEGTPVQVAGPVASR